MKKWVLVKCFDCGKGWDKREDSLKHWMGRCNICSRKEVVARPEVKEILRRNGNAVFEKYGQIPNGNRFKKGEMSGDKSPTWKGGLPNCVDCGKQLSNRQKNRCVRCHGKSRIGKKRPIEYIERMRKLAPRGEKHWNWKGGSSGQSVLIRMSSEYKQWRKQVFERDNYTCQECGARNVRGLKLKLNADHIKPFALHPELRFDVSNGRTLCEDCHKDTDTFGIKLYNKSRVK